MHRVDGEYLEGDSFGESEFDSDNRKGKRFFEKDTTGLPGTKRMKKSFGNATYDTILDSWSESMVARKTKDLAKTNISQVWLCNNLVGRGILYW